MASTEDGTLQSRLGKHTYANIVMHGVNTCVVVCLFRLVGWLCVLTDMADKTV